MTQPNSKLRMISLLHLFFGVALVVSFFFPWVSWDGYLVKGSAMASGDFFKITEVNFKLANPFPKLSFTFYIFWVIPILGALSAALVLLKKKTVPFCYIAGASSLALIVVYYLFTKTLIDLGIGQDVFAMLKPTVYIHLMAAVGLIVTSFPAKSLLTIVFWLMIGPVVAYAGYKLGEKYIMSETFADSKDAKADYTLDATMLINEFLTNDTATNKKYLDKMLVINGNASAVELKDDSTSSVSFADSTGSYVIFSLEKKQFEEVKTIRQGDPVSLKGVCSGSIYSEILGTTSITFKRAILITK